MLTLVAIPPTNILLGMTVPYLGIWLARWPFGVIDGLRLLGDRSSDYNRENTSEKLSALAIIV